MRFRNEWVEKNPFQYYKMKIDKTNVKIPLTKEELDTLIRRGVAQRPARQNPGRVRLLLLHRTGIYRCR